MLSLKTGALLSGESSACCEEWQKSNVASRILSHINSRIPSHHCGQGRPRLSTCCLLLLWQNAIAAVEAVVAGRDLRAYFAPDHFVDPAACFGTKSLFIPPIFPGRSSLDRIDQTMERLHEPHLLRYIVPTSGDNAKWRARKTHHECSEPSLGRRMTRDNARMTLPLRSRNHTLF